MHGFRGAWARARGRKLCTEGICEWLEGSGRFFSFFFFSFKQVRTDSFPFLLLLVFKTNISSCSKKDGRQYATLFICTSVYLLGTTTGDIYSKCSSQRFPPFSCHGLATSKVIQAPIYFTGKETGSERVRTCIQGCTANGGGAGTGLQCHRCQLGGSLLHRSLPSWGLL